ncbi:hypothetical protein ACI51Z_01870 [Pectobacterium carotovorum]|uniref:hypothetical protein n=1 Tax=Pectobacterium carotovorum TaxID=554 RepID=UPI0038694233
MRIKAQQNKNIKRNDEQLSSLGVKIRQTPNVEGLVERKIQKEDSDINTITGKFNYNENVLNYIGIEKGEFLFINIRLNVEYKKDELKTHFINKNKLLEHINEQNKKNLGMKIFVTENEDETLLVSSNIEYILNSKTNDFSFVENALQILSIAPMFLNINKTSE